MTYVVAHRLDVQDLFNAVNNEETWVEDRATTSAVHLRAENAWIWPPQSSSKLEQPPTSLHLQCGSTWKVSNRSTSQQGD